MVDSHFIPQQPQQTEDFLSYKGDVGYNSLLQTSQFERAPFQHFELQAARTSSPGLPPLSASNSPSLNSASSSAFDSFDSLLMDNRSTTPLLPPSSSGAFEIPSSPLPNGMPPSVDQRMPSLSINTNIQSPAAQRQSIQSASSSTFQQPAPLVPDSATSGPLFSPFAVASSPVNLRANMFTPQPIRARKNSAVFNPLNFAYMRPSSTPLPTHMTPQQLKLQQQQQGNSTPTSAFPMKSGSTGLLNFPPTPPISPEFLAELQNARNNTGSPVQLRDSEENSFPCKYPGCNKTFAKRYSLRSHMTCHSIDRPHGCSCGAAFQRKHDLNRHVRLSVQKGRNCMAMKPSSPTGAPDRIRSPAPLRAGAF